MCNCRKTKTPVVTSAQLPQSSDSPQQTQTDQQSAANAIANSGGQ